MASMQIELDPIALREATSQAIMGILSPEMKTKMIETAITALLNKSTETWDYGATPLQKAFNAAVEQVAREVAVQYIANDKTIKPQLEHLVAKTVTKVFSLDQDNLAERMADAFVDGIKCEARSRA